MRDILEVVSEEGFPPSVGELSRSVENFDEKLDALIGLIVNRRGHASHRRRYLLHEAATTSDFPILFGNVLERQLIAKYRIATPDWRTYIGSGTQRDFRASGQEVIGIFGLQSELPLVPQMGEYTADAELDEGKVSIVLKKYGRVFGLAWETILGDEGLGAFNDVPERLVNAALAREYLEATRLFAAAAGPHTGLYGATITHPIDGAAVTNKGVLPFNIDNLGTTVSLMRQQRDKDNNPVVIEGFELVVPPQLEIEMLKALNPASVVIAGNTDVIRSSANVIAQLNITGHVNPYLPVVDTSATSDTTWYVFARLNTGMAAKLNFLAGRTAPQLVMKSPDKVAVGGAPLSPMEGDFWTDAVRWRVRHILGGTQIDPRLTYAQVGP